jgi:hypothetical protein
MAVVRMCFASYLNPCYVIHNYDCSISWTSMSSLLQEMSTLFHHYNLPASRGTLTSSRACYELGQMCAWLIEMGTLPCTGQHSMAAFRHVLHCFHVKSTVHSSKRINRGPPIQYWLGASYHARSTSRIAWSLSVGNQCCACCKSSASNRRSTSGWRTAVVIVTTEMACGNGCARPVLYMHGTHFQIP